MIFSRLLDIIEGWLATGRFPREEFRVRRAIAIPFIGTVLLLTAAFVDRWLGG